MPNAFRSLLTIILLGFLSACSDTSYQLSIRFPGVLEVTVRDAFDGSPIQGASITVVNADTRDNIAWLLSDSDGHARVTLNKGAYFVRVAAQGYLPSPPMGQDAVAFQILNNLTTTETYRLNTDVNALNSGQLNGKMISTAGFGIAGVLVVAKESAQGFTLSTTCSGDGTYRLYNVPPGDYAIEGLIAGYRQVSSPGSVNVPPSTAVSDVDRTLEAARNADLSGKVSFLAVVNGIVDITLLQPDTLAPVPGLSTFNETGGNTYLLERVPPGDYLAWASYRNDGYVMDPDSIRKFGLPGVSFSSDNGNQELNFSVTNAITLVSPTNTRDLLIPQVINSSQPLFQWVPYPSSKEYIIEVRNSEGEVIWGGYDSSGNILHSPIAAGSSSRYFNFDGSATAPLIAGETYRWKIFADNDAAQGIQGLISASESQMGLFRYWP